MPLALHCKKYEAKVVATFTIVGGLWLVQKERVAPPLARWPYDLQMVQTEGRTDLRCASQ